MCFTSVVAAYPKTTSCTTGGKNTKSRIRLSRKICIISFLNIWTIRSHIAALYSSFLNFFMAIINIAIVKMRRRSPSHQRMVSPTPLRNIPLRIVTKYRAGTI